MPAELQADPDIRCLCKILGLMVEQDRGLSRVEGRNQSVKIRLRCSDPARTGGVVNPQKLQPARKDSHRVPENPNPCSLHDGYDPVHTGVIIVIPHYGENSQTTLQL